MNIGKGRARVSIRRVGVCGIAFEVIVRHLVRANARIQALAETRLASRAKVTGIV
jgi:hypothetical protein